MWWCDECSLPVIKMRTRVSWGSREYDDRIEMVNEVESPTVGSNITLPEDGVIFTFLAI